MVLRGQVRHALILVHDIVTETAWLVHGKDDLASVDLALVTAGEGGFVISGVPWVSSWNRLDRPGVDVDGDGLDDLWLVGCKDGAEVIRAPDGWAAPARVATPIKGVKCEQLEAADLDGDGFDDLLISWSEPLLGAMWILHGPVALDGDTIAIDPACDLGLNNYAFADVDGDGDFELITPWSNDGVHLVLRAEDVESYAPKPETIGGCDVVSSCPPPAPADIVVSIGYFDQWFRALGDVNGDGRGDLFFGSAGAVVTRACDVSR